MSLKYNYNRLVTAICKLPKGSNALLKLYRMQKNCKWRIGSMAKNEGGDTDGR